MILSDTGVTWWFSPKSQILFVCLVLVTILVVFLADMMGLHLPSTTKVLTVMMTIVFCFVLITILDRRKRRF